ncbi:MAG: SDR family oxidoreductase [Gemmataceae bacterium]|nr:SDR family oxidoreductase [Gemmataceae bacterium]
MLGKKEKTALVAGCGYLGSQLATGLARLGIRVFATTRRRTDAIRALGAEPVVCDFTRPATLATLPAADWVVYCAASDAKGANSFRDIHLDGLLAVAHSQASRGFQGRFVLVSSTSVYCQEDGNWVDENSPAQPQTEAGQITLEAEERLREIIPSAVVLRFAGIYGPGRLIRAKTLQQGEALVCNPDRWLNLIHVTDGARAVIECFVKGAPGPIYTICDDLPVLRGEFYTHLARVLKTPEPRFELPPEGSALAARESNNRRISNAKMKKEILDNLLFPTFQEGLASGEECLSRG